MKGGLIGGAVLGAVAGIGGVAAWAAARRAGVSLAAFAINALAAKLASDSGDLSDFEAKIARNREAGPAVPPKSLRKRFEFSDTQVGEDRVFRLDPRARDSTVLRLLYLHGGAYVHEVQSIQWNVVGGLVKRLGAGVVAPVYPLAPEHGWQEGLASVERVYLDLVAEVGAENVVLLGDSAGGGLALVLAQQLRDQGKPLPAALVLVSPWLDVGATGADQPQLEARDPVLRINFLRHCGRLWARDLTLDDPRVSPLFGDHSGLPPTIVFSGGRDVVSSDSLRLALRNPAVVHHHHPAMMHVWLAAPLPEARKAFDEAADFIRGSVRGAQAAG